MNSLLLLAAEPAEELKDLVYGLTPIPLQAGAPILRRPMFWAVVVFLFFVALNIIFW